MCSGSIYSLDWLHKLENVRFFPLDSNLERKPSTHNSQPFCDSRQLTGSPFKPSPPFVSRDTRLVCDVCDVYETYSICRTRSRDLDYHSHDLAHEHVEVSHLSLKDCPNCNVLFQFITWHSPLKQVVLSLERLDHGYNRKEMRCLYTQGLGSL